MTLGLSVCIATKPRTLKEGEGQGEGTLGSWYTMGEGALGWGSECLSNACQEEMGGYAYVSKTVNINQPPTYKKSHKN